MGLYPCPHCTPGTEIVISTGDVYLNLPDPFWVSDIVIHYLEIHRYAPPSNFVQQVMELDLEKFRLIAGLKQSDKVAPQLDYLGENFPIGDNPKSFIDKLKEIIEIATDAGNRRQSKSI